MKGEGYMSVKQDCVGARTASDIERKYNFGKRFAEVLGIATDARDKVDSVESYLFDEDEQHSTGLSRDTEKIVAKATAEITTEVSEIKKEVEVKVDADSVDFIVEQTIVENGVDRVVTEQGYSFTDNGLDISKTGSEMANKIDHEGMKVTRSGEEILTATNKGVNATNLHARTYLIIGSGNGRSRFEDYGFDRTGCFWIGG
jgi:hypothetical protein